MLLDHEYSATGWGQDPIKLGKGEFVRPIEINWVPKHVLEDERWKHYSVVTNVFAYTKHGIVPIPRSKVGLCD
jgi:hypothetical protein